MDKTFGASAQASGGFIQSAYNPDNWLLSLTRAIKNYVNRHSSTIYDIRMEFPDTKQRQAFAQLEKTVIHFEIDDIDSPRFGMGDNIVDATFDDISKTVTEFEAKPHIVMFDVGIWTSAKAGGTTARMRAYQLLDELFNGSIAFKRMLAEEGVEIRDFRGGSFVQEAISDVPVFRALGITLSVRVFERRTDDPKPYIEQVNQLPALTIS